MKLINLSVENFGVLHHEVVDCQNGLNVFCRDNGAGKTTLAAFLCAMLYGLPVSRKTDLEENERKKYQPWQGGPYGGSMTFAVGDKSYRAERYFTDSTSTRRDTFVLYDLADNSVSNDYSEELGKELFGIDAAAFARSVYMPQRWLSDDRGRDSITARLSRAIDGNAGEADGDVYRTAAAVLDKQRQFYVRQGGRGYLSDLEQRLSELHEREYAAMRAKDDAERYSEEARILLEEIEVLAAEKQQVLEHTHAAQIRSAILAHGKSLMEHRDRQLSAAAQTRQFLHLDDDAGIAAGRYGSDAVRAAEESLRESRRLGDRLAQTEEAMMQATEKQNRIHALFRNGVPEDAETASLAFTVQMLGELRGNALGNETTFPSCFSEEELQRHTGQALMHAQMTEVLAQPQSAQTAYHDAMSAAGMEIGDELPDEDTMQAYADVLGAIAANREKQKQLLPQKQEADAALQSVEENCRAIPAQSEIVAMRTRFDALRGRTEEIEELEARQRLAVQIDETIRRNRRVRIAVGCGLLAVTAVLCVLYGMTDDVRFLFAGGTAALPGLFCFILGLMTRSDENDETRALEDAAQKRLCVKKSEYETEKTKLYEFLDRIGGDADAVMDENDAAERFDAAAAAAREREVCAEHAASLNEQYNRLTQEEAHLCASLTSYTKSGGGELADIGDDRAVFSDYRKKIQACTAAHRLYEEEQKTRAQARARMDALALALDLYLRALNDACPEDIQKCGDTENGTYAERMAAWCRTADLLRMQIGEQQTLLERRSAMEAELSQKLDALLSDGAELASAAEPDGAEETVLSRAQTILSLCAQYQSLADEKEVNAQQRSDLRQQIAVCDAHCTQILDGYFADPTITAEEGLQTIRTREAAYTEEMNRLREAQRQFGAFLSEHGMTEETLSDALLESKPSEREMAQSDHTASALEQQIREKTDLRAEVIQKANHASEIGAELAALRAQIQKTEQARTEAARALSVIRTAQSCLEQAKSAQSTRYLSYMQTRFRVYYSRLTGMTEKEAEGLSLDASFAVQAEILGARRDMAYFSRGMQDGMDFCVRLAMIDAMYTDGGRKNDAYLPPLLLDDPFVNLDEKHLAAAKGLLSEISERFQILYFVCHESRI